MIIASKFSLRDPVPALAQPFDEVSGGFLIVFDDKNSHDGDR
jgi:hypothetical protein